jgi:hypothetical protein
MTMERYFLRPEGVSTGRMAVKPSAGHIEIATAFLGPLCFGVDAFDQMFALGFASVLETNDRVSGDSPRELTKNQKRFLKSRRGRVHQHPRRPAISDAGGPIVWFFFGSPMACLN